MPVQSEAYMERYCYKSLFRVDRLIGDAADRALGNKRGLENFH